MLRIICEKVKKFQHFLLDILYRNYHLKKAWAQFAPPVQETVKNKKTGVEQYIYLIYVVNSRDVHWAGFFGSGTSL